VPLLPAPGARRQSASTGGGSAPTAVAQREGLAATSWKLRPPSTRTGLAALTPIPFVPRPAAAPAPALWLSMAPTAMAGILSVLLAMALLFAAQ
jgi:hypothetical protein